MQYNRVVGMLQWEGAVASAARGGLATISLGNCGYVLASYRLSSNVLLTFLLGMQNDMQMQNVGSARLVSSLLKGPISVGCTAVVHYKDGHKPTHLVGAYNQNRMRKHDAKRKNTKTAASNTWSHSDITYLV